MGYVKMMNGVVLTAFLFVSLCLVASCSKNEPYTATTPTLPPTPVVVVPPAADTTLVSYLALGDSYTIGQGVNAGARFPTQTVGLLKQDGINIDAPVYLATTGWTTTNLLNAIAAADLQSQYSIVTLLIGVNDQFQTRDTTNYRDRFTTLLGKAIKLAGDRKSRVFVLSIPDYSVTPFVPDGSKERVSQEIDWFNAINKDVCSRWDISYTDITPSTREARTNRSLIAADSLHPSGLEYLKWAAMLAPKIKAAL
jgi:lysophospholipase L1-like esterase